MRGGGGGWGEGSAFGGMFLFGGGFGGEGGGGCEGAVVVGASDAIDARWRAEAEGLGTMGL